MCHIYTVYISIHTRAYTLCADLTFYLFVGRKPPECRRLRSRCLALRTTLKITHQKSDGLRIKKPYHTNLCTPSPSTSSPNIAFSPGTVFHFLAFENWGDSHTQSLISSNLLNHFSPLSEVIIVAHHRLAFFYDVSTEQDVHKLAFSLLREKKKHICERSLCSRGTIAISFSWYCFVFIKSCGPKCFRCQSVLLLLTFSWSK